MILVNRFPNFSSFARVAPHCDNLRNFAEFSCFLGCFPQFSHIFHHSMCVGFPLFFSAVSVILHDFHHLYQFSPAAMFFSTFEHILRCRFVCKWGGAAPPPRFVLLTTNAFIFPDFSQFHDFFIVCNFLVHYFSAVSVVLHDFHHLYQFSPAAMFFSTFDHILGCRFVCKWRGLCPPNPPAVVHNNPGLLIV